MANNEVQALITEIDRSDRVRRTMMKRLEKQGEIMERAKILLRANGIRPYRKTRKIKKRAKSRQLKKVLSGSRPYRKARS